MIYKVWFSTYWSCGMQFWQHQMLHISISRNHINPSAILCNFLDPFYPLHLVSALPSWKPSRHTHHCSLLLSRPANQIDSLGPRDMWCIQKVAQTMKLIAFWKKTPVFLILIPDCNWLPAKQSSYLTATHSAYGLVNTRISSWVDKLDTKLILLFANHVW